MVIYRTTPSNLILTICKNDDYRPYYFVRRKKLVVDSPSPIRMVARWLLFLSSAIKVTVKKAPHTPHTKKSSQNAYCNTCNMVYKIHEQNLNSLEIITYKIHVTSLLLHKNLRISIVYLIKCIYLITRTARAFRIVVCHSAILYFLK